jgi:hypothetical protein
MRKFRATEKAFLRNDWQRFNPGGLELALGECEKRVRRSHGELTVDSNALGTKITAIFPDETLAS